MPIYSRSSRGLVIYDFALGAMRELKDLGGSPVFSRSDPAVMYLLQSAESGGEVHYTVRSVNFRTGAQSTVAD